MGTALSEMYQYTMGELPGASKIHILRVTVETIRQWCNRTEAWEDDLNAIDIETGKDSYQLDSPIDDTEIVGVVHRPSDDVGVHLDGRLLSPGVDFTIPVDKDLLKLDAEPTRDISAGLTVKAAFAPILDSTADTEVPDRLFNDYHDIWAKGVMARMMLMKKKKWTDKDTARLYHNMYWDGIRLAISERGAGRTNRSLRVQHPSAFA